MRFSNKLPHLRFSLWHLNPRCEVMNNECSETSGPITTDVTHNVWALRTTGWWMVIKISYFRAEEVKWTHRRQESSDWSALHLAIYLQGVCTKKRNRIAHVYLSNWKNAPCGWGWRWICELSLGRCPSHVFCLSASIFNQLYQERKRTAPSIFYCPTTPHT